MLPHTARTTSTDPLGNAIGGPVQHPVVLVGRQILSCQGWVVRAVPFGLVDEIRQTVPPHVLVEWAGELPDDLAFLADLEDPSRARLADDGVAVGHSLGARADVRPEAGGRLCFI
jgi:hypothetical protein